MDDRRPAGMTLDIALMRLDQTNRLAEHCFRYLTRAAEQVFVELAKSDNPLRAAIVLKAWEHYIGWIKDIWSEYESNHH